MAFIDDRDRPIVLWDDPERRYRVRSFQPVLSTSGAKHDPAVRSVLLRRKFVRSKETLVPKSPRVAAVIALSRYVAATIPVMVVLGWQLRFNLATFGLIAAIVVLLFGLGRVWNAWLPTLYRRYARELAALPPHCAACWYPLGHTPQPDGCTVCPECGAAWKLTQSKTEQNH